MAEPQFTQLQTGFDVRTISPIDRRFELTTEEMRSGMAYWNGLSIPLANILPDRYFVQCKESGLLYEYNKTAVDLFDNYHLGKFKLITKVTDVVDSEGNTLTDANGVVKTYDARGTKLKVAEAKLNDLSAVVNTMKGDGEAKEKLNKDEVVDYIEEEFEKKGLQGKMIIYGTADVLDSEGVPHKNNENIPGVHVTYEEFDPKVGPKKVLIDHDEIIGGEGWKSLFQVGGIPANRFFTADTPIKEVLRLLLVGDPMFDNAIYFGSVSGKITDMTKDVIGKLTFGTARPGHSLYEEMQEGWAWTDALDCYLKFPVIVVPERLWHGQSAPGQTDPDRKLLKLTDVYLCDSDGIPISEVGLPVPYEIFYEDTVSGESSLFRVYMLKDRCTQTGDIKFKYMFEEV